MPQEHSPDRAGSSTIQQISKRHHVSVSKLYVELAEGHLKSIKIGALRRVMHQQEAARLLDVLHAKSDYSHDTRMGLRQAADAAHVDIDRLRDLDLRQRKAEFAPAILAKFETEAILEMCRHLGMVMLCHRLKTGMRYQEMDVAERARMAVSVGGGKMTFIEAAQRLVISEFDAERVV